MSYLAYCVYRTLAEFIALLPLPAGFRLGRFLGWVAYDFVGRYRRLVLKNLEIAFGGEKSKAELRKLAREHFATLGGNLLSSFKLGTMTPEEISARVRIENMAALHKAAEPGRGVVLVLSHLGNWELLAQLVPHGPPGRRVGTVYQALGNKYFDRHVKNIRIRMGLVPFDRRRGFQEPITFLRRGGVLGVLVDQHAGDGGIWAPFFGRLSSTSPLAATVALRTGAPLVPVAVYTVGCARWRLVISDPLPREKTDPEQLTAEINVALEKEIRVSPSDWFWVHNRWKTPSPQFLLSHYKRGVALPRGFSAGQLKPFRILIRSANWLGDAVMSAPAVRAIKNGRPDAHVTILTPAKLADFWKTMPEVDDVIPIAPRDSVFTVGRKIRNRFDVAFVFPNSPRSGLEVRLGGIPRRIGYRRPWRKFTINASVADPSPGPMRHEAHQYLRLAHYAGANTKGMLSMQAARPAVPETAPLGLAPGAEYGPAKRWLPENFAAVARRVNEQTGRRWHIFGVKADRPAADAIAGQLDGQCDNLAGGTTLAQLIERLRECSLVLTNDTGTMHLAAHLGVPVLAIFGSTEHILTGPMGKNSRVLRHHVSCSPCFLRECPLDFRCMKSVTVEEVTAAVLTTLGK
ncbi:MAG TPA: lipopolysaccharide heptosyltransferase II [Chthoniobacteraceae bacterium]|jgi:lipopolysaccharide heptosyltransferase II|nr:lipopolysaccharide heptosyltransferase II [Chthoniobacteraceae bacterium]